MTAYGADNRPVRVTGKIAQYVYFVACPSYYSADFGKLFRDLSNNH